MYNNYFQIYLSIQINLHRLFPLCPSQLLLTVKKKCPVRKNYGPVRINYGPVLKNYGPVRKNHEMGHFAYKNTYKEAIFDLWPKKKKSMLKSGIPDMIPEKTFYWL